MDNKNIRNNGYQPQRPSAPVRELKHGYQPTTAVTSTPPNKGNSVQPAPKK